MEPQTTDTSDQINIITNLEQMIKSNLASISQLTEDLDKHSSMLQAIFDNDQTYQEHTRLAKEAAKVKSTTKQQILKQPQAADLDNKVKTLKSELKEAKAALSDYLREYQRLSGASEIEDDKGEVQEIVYTVKLVKRLFRQ